MFANMTSGCSGSKTGRWAWRSVSLWRSGTWIETHRTCSIITSLIYQEGCSQDGLDNPRPLKWVLAYAIIWSHPQLIAQLNPQCSAHGYRGAHQLVFWCLLASLNIVKGQSWLSSSSLGQKITEGITTAPTGSAHLKIAIPISGQSLAWAPPTFCNYPHFVTIPAPHGSHYVVVPMILYQTSRRTTHRLKIVRNPCLSN